MFRSICVVLAIISTVALMFVVCQEPALGVNVKCFEAEVNPSQGTLSADSFGQASDSRVWDIYASTGVAGSSDPIRIEVQNVSNVQVPPSVATPATYYNLASTGFDATDYVVHGSRGIGVSIMLTTITSDGTFDAKIYVDGASDDWESPDGDTPDVNVDTYYD